MRLTQQGPMITQAEVTEAHPKEYKDGKYKPTPTNNRIYNSQFVERDKCQGNLVHDQQGPMIT